MWNLICFRLALCMANFETEVYEFLKLFNLSRRALDSVVSHHFLTFLTTRLPVSWLLGKYHSEMKCFFFASKRKCLLLLNRNIGNSPHVNAENCKLYNGASKRVRDGFARHLKSLWRPYVLQLRRNELKCGFFRQNSSYCARIYILILLE